MVITLEASLPFIDMTRDLNSANMPVCNGYD